MNRKKETNGASALYIGEKERGKTPKNQWKRACLLVFTALCATLTHAYSIKGIVTDAENKEALPGVNVVIPNSSLYAVTDMNGAFEIKNVREGTYSIKVTYIGYKAQNLHDIKVRKNTQEDLHIELVPENTQLEAVTVIGQRKQNTEAAVVEAQKNSRTVENGVSSQQIARTQDRNASEVIRRVPGISIIEDRFVIVRGLSQRYNNVWINGAAVPSTEADSRAFSFDIIPSSQLDNMVIVKSPAPEYPADFTGGFIKIQTKDIPAQNGFSMAYTTGINTATHFKDFLYNPGSGTDFLGFDNGMRSIKEVPSTYMNDNDLVAVDKASKYGFNNDWQIKSKTPLPDQKINLSYNYRKELKGGKTFAMLSALNYSYVERIVNNIQNARYSIYDSKNDEPDPVYEYTDNQYISRATLGGMLNLTYRLNNRDKLELKNIVNQIGQNRYTTRKGTQFLSGEYLQEKEEYSYSSRTTYSGQLAGTFLRDWGKMDAEAGYSYANKREPDRRFINRQENDVQGDPHFGQMETEPTDISRDFNSLDEHIVSAGGNYTRDFDFMQLKPTLKSGVYGEFRTRDYTNRSFNYQWDVAKWPELGYRDPVNGILLEENYGIHKLYVHEETDNRNSYKGNNLLGAAYLAFNIPIQKFNIYTGVRFESSNMTLTNNTTIHGTGTSETELRDNDFFPSINVSYKFNEKHQIRAAYATSINRPEFREVSPSVYYDFDLYSFVKGNPNLKSAYIQNVDLRYEIYPGGAGETVSLGLFYKHFKNPIEWTYIDAGGTYTYTFENAGSADNFGIELEVKKNLAFIGLEDFTWLFNGALISSQVNFDDNSLEKDRPMQGQSPYLVNTGLFYNNPKIGFSAGALYNRIGKRIVGVGRVDTSQGGSINNDIPDAYEMPRDVIDLSISQKIGKRVEIKAAARDILNQNVVFKQFPKYYDENGTLQEREQTTKSFKPGSNISLSVSVNL